VLLAFQRGEQVLDTKELGAGVVSALVLADPAVNQSLLATARARGVKIVEDEDEMLANVDHAHDWLCLAAFRR
jgi:hypothetical protein